jgi:hypothetical protein
MKKGLQLKTLGTHETAYFGNNRSSHCDQGSLLPFISKHTDWENNQRWNTALLLDITTCSTKPAPWLRNPGIWTTTQKK